MPRNLFTLESISKKIQHREQLNRYQTFSDRIQTRAQYNKRMLNCNLNLNKGKGLINHPNGYIQFVVHIGGTKLV